MLYSCQPPFRPVKLPGREQVNFERVPVEMFCVTRVKVVFRDEAILAYRTASSPNTTISDVIVEELAKALSAPDSSHPRT